MKGNAVQIPNPIRKTIPEAASIIWAALLVFGGINKIKASKHSRNAIITGANRNVSPPPPPNAIIAVSPKIPKILNSVAVQNLFIRSELYYYRHGVADSLQLF